MAKKQLKVKPKVKAAPAPLEKHGCIYKLTNLINGDSYIGKDKSGEPETHRWADHIKQAIKGGGSYIHNAIFDYDFMFSAEIIWSGPVEHLNWKEKYYIKKHHTYVHDPKYKGGYNLTPGGDGFHGKHTAASKKKTSIASKRTWAENYEKLRMACQARWDKTTPEEFAAFSAAQSKAWENPARRKRTIASLKRSWERKTPEARAAVGAAIKAAWDRKTPAELAAFCEAHRLTCEDPAVRKRMSDAQLKGYKENPERRERLSVSNSKRYEDPAEREKTSAAGKRYYENPAAREKVSAANRLRFEDPLEREKMSVANLLRFEDPAERKKLSVAQLRSYAENPERCKDLSVAQLRSYAEKPERCEKQSAAGKLRYEDSAERVKTGKASSIAWARKTPEERAAGRAVSKASASKMWERRTPEERSAIGRKILATKRANALKKANKPK